MPKHPTPAQREASRRNGGKSHGPHDTSQTRFNALKHGLLSRKACFRSEEDRLAYQELHEALVEDLRPVGTLQAMLVERLASAHWRHIRAVELRAWWEMPRAEREAAYASGELVAGPWVFTSGTDNYARGGELLLRYEHELQRQFDTALRELSVVRRQASGTAGKRESVDGSRRSAGTAGQESGSRRQASGTAGERESVVGSRQSVAAAGQESGSRRQVAGTARDGRRRSAVELGIVRRSDGARGPAGRTPSPQPSPSGRERGTEASPPGATQGPVGARFTAPTTAAGAMNGAPTAEAQGPMEVGPRGKLRPMRDARRRGKHGKGRFVVHDEPGGAVVVEEPSTPPQTQEEVEAFFAGLDERLQRMRELEKGARGGR